MNVSWSEIKEVFYAIGSVAGVIALARPLVESKYQRDASRVDEIKSLVSEQMLVDLEGYIYQHRQVRAEYFRPFDHLSHQLRTNQDAVRFAGPLAKYFRRELKSLLKNYGLLRNYIQVNEWQPRTHKLEDGTEYLSWDFNKSAFTQQDGIQRDYAQHLDEAAEQAVQMKRAFQRFQLVAELHLYEVLVARWLLPRRNKTHGL